MEQKTDGRVRVKTTPPFKLKDKNNRHFRAIMTPEALKNEKKLREAKIKEAKEKVKPIIVKKENLSKPA